MKKLYLDCDGVILDTINRSYQLFKQLNITEDSDRQKFYEETDWDELILLSGEINNSISKIELLMNYFDVKILTHVHSSKEEESKIKYFKNVLPEVEVIAVPKSIEKADMINPKDSILVDDYYPNLIKWEEKGGIPVKFSDSGKNYDCIVITDLLDLIELKFDNKMVKVKE